MMDGRQQSSSSMELEKPESYWNTTWPTSVDFRMIPYPRGSNTGEAMRRAVLVDGTTTL